MNTVTAQNQKGFTLVEIAIVLVIIGLLLGGVLKGQELITNSKIKAVTGDLEGITAAYYAYQDRTGRIPGWNDTNDGQINDPQAFWDDLRREGFIAGASGAASPRHDLDGIFIPSGFTAGVFGGGKNFLCATNLENAVAQGLDTKIDDGISTTGSMLAEKGTDALTAAATGTYDGSEDATVLCKEL